MRKGERIGCIIAIIVIGILFLISSTDLVFKDKTREIYNVCVILENGQQEQYQNLKKGIEASAEKWNIDLKYESFSMEYGVEDQNRALKEAREDGAQAILIDPMNEGALRSYLQNQPSDIPVILLNSRVESEKISSIYTADMRQIGEELGKLIVAQESGTGKKVHAYTSYHEKDKTDVYQLCKAFRGELERAGIPVEIYAGNKINADGGRNIVTAALDSRALLQILNQEKVPKNLYGVGYSNHILEKLAQGEIKAIVMYNEFDMGYLAMEAAVKYIEKDMTDRINILEHYVIYPEDVYREDKETLLFPIS